jgi:hypothetical protein
MYTVSAVVLQASARISALPWVATIVGNKFKLLLHNWCNQ